jgi:flagellar FliL protein
VKDEESEVEEQQEDAPEPGPLRRIKPLKLAILAGIVLVQIALAFAVAHFLILPRLPGHGEPPAAAEEAAPAEAAKDKERGAQEHGEIVMMEDLIVNLMGRDSNHFLKITAGLEFTQPELAPELEERMPVLRDILIDHLSNRPLEEVSNREGREEIKNKLLQEFNARLAHGQLINIYFSDFVVQ